MVRGLHYDSAQQRLWSAPIPELALLRSKSPIATHRGGVTVAQGTSFTVAAAANVADVEIEIGGLAGLKGNVSFGIGVQGGACCIMHARTQNIVHTTGETSRHLRLSCADAGASQSQVARGA